MAMTAGDHYTIVSADCHAGANHATYRDYLEARYHEDFDAWRDGYKNPFRDLQDGGRVRNWDNERRLGDLHADGQVGEVVFPNTVPPFFPSFVLLAPPPTAEQYEHRLAGIRAHNRWLADWCADHPAERAGIGQIFLNDADDDLPRLPSEYFAQSCSVGVSQPTPADVDAMRDLGLGRVMWGSDYPHREGTGPYTREHLRQLFSDWEPGDLQQVLAGTAADVYGFDLDALAPLAAEYGPTVAELAEPLRELPVEPNEALLKGARRRAG
jgi:predicted TIM-barrel fold metal-dependent hydrolase